MTLDELNRERQDKRITVVQQSQYDGGPISFGAAYTPGSFREVLDAFEAVYEEIPADYRETALCEIASEGGYEGEHHATVEIGYWRPETDAEVEERVGKLHAAKAASVEEARRTYLRLKAQFEPKEPR